MSGLANALRRLADFVEAGGDVGSITIHALTAEQVRALFSAIGGHFDKNAGDYFFTLRQTFEDNAVISIMVERSKICRKVMVTKEVEAWECGDLFPETEAAIDAIAQPVD